MKILCLFKNHKPALSDVEFLEIGLRVFLKNSEFFLENGKNLSKSVFVEAGELIFCLNMLH
jgi:hypothetical protein